MPLKYVIQCSYSRHSINCLWNIVFHMDVPGIRCNAPKIMYLMYIRCSRHAIFACLFAVPGMQRNVSGIFNSILLFPACDGWIGGIYNTPQSIRNCDGRLNGYHLWLIAEECVLFTRSIKNIFIRNKCIRKNIPVLQPCYRITDDCNFLFMNFNCFWHEGPTKVFFSQSDLWLKRA